MMNAQARTEVVVAQRPPLPPFTRETAIQKVRLAEEGWNSRNPEKVSLAYSPDSRWRNRAEFANGRSEIVALLTRRWTKELDYRLIKELWAFDGIASRFASLTNAATTRGIGLGLTAMKTGNSMKTA
jgi:nuclear transport factor 2 (NTF2) superfamily protein